MKTKQELILEAAELAKLHQNKKEVIENIFKDLDKEKNAAKILNGISSVNQLLSELKEIEEKHFVVIELIKK